MELTESHRTIALVSRGFRLPSMIDDDLKLIKQLNKLFKKLVKTNTDIVFLEIINIFKILNNSMKIKEIPELFLEYIDLEFHQVVLFILNNIDNITLDIMKNIFKDCSYEE